MKTIYLECGMGAAGDMLSAALLELCPDREAALARLNAMKLPGVVFAAEKSEKCGVIGTHMRVTVNGAEEESLDEHDHEHEHHHDHKHDHEHQHHHDHEHDHEHHHDHEHGHHHHHSLADIRAIIDGADAPESVKVSAMDVYTLIAQAESQVHGRAVEEIHFHEVGAMDAVADVMAVSMLIDLLGADQIVASPVHVGSGYVKCVHGVLPVPAPATALLLTGVPTYGGQVKGELCTPTGAALLKRFAASFGDRPVMSVQAIGYGMGKKDFERANCVRAFLGESESRRETITRLECNIDDMTPEETGFALETLRAAGARDVYALPIQMKKSRPGVMICVICLPDEADVFADLIMKHTSTLGVRRLDMTRYALSREIVTRETPLGPVRFKTSRGMGVSREKPEYEDVARIAREKNISFAEARDLILSTHD